MELIYLYHSGFALAGSGFTLVFDYFEDSEGPDSGILHSELLQRDGRFYVLASHFHADHFSREVLKWREQRPDIVYLFSKDILRRRRAGKDEAIFLKKGDTYADECLAVRAFGSTDVGVSFLVEVGGKKIFHAGDLNNWHWMDESSEDEWKRDEKRFIDEIGQIKKEYNKIDLAMFPIDPRLGKEYMRGGIQFIEAINTSMFIPMHFWNDFVSANKFQTYAREHGVSSPDIKYRGQEFDV